MIDRWFSPRKLPMTIEQFFALPENPAYKYEYIDGEAWLTPRPKIGHALLELRPMEVSERLEVRREPVRIRPLVDADWTHLPSLFAAAFHRVEPFKGLGDDRRLEAARDCLEHTRSGGDGPLIPPACVVADRLDRNDGGPLAAGLITLMPDVPLDSLRGLNWRSPPPPDALERRLGRPHLTWIFVPPLLSGNGLGEAMLAVSTRALLDLGYAEMASTFLLGNPSSMLWHWRMGFQLKFSSPPYHRFRLDRDD